MADSTEPAGEVFGPINVRIEAPLARFATQLHAAEQMLLRFATKTEATSASMMRFGRNYSLLVTAPIMASAVLFSRRAIRAYSQQEEALERLRGAFMTVTDSANADRLTAYFEQYADNIQRVTRYSDDEVLATLALGKTYGIQTRQLKEAMRAALALTTVGYGLRTSMVQISRAAMGNAGMLRRFIPELRNVKDAKRQWGIIMEWANKRMAILQRTSGTYAARMAMLKNALNDVDETFGKMIIETFNLDRIIIVLRDNVKRFNEMLKQIPLVVLKTIGVVGVLVVSLGALSFALGSVAWMTQFVIKGLVMMARHGKAIALMVWGWRAMLIPVLAVTAAVVAVGGALLIAAGKGDTMAERLVSGFARVRSAITGSFSAVAQWVHNATFAIKAFWTYFAIYAEYGAKSVVRALAVAFQNVFTVLLDVKRQFGAVWSDITAIISNAMVIAVAKVQNMWHNLVANIKEMWRAAFEWVTSRGKVDFAPKLKGFNEDFVPPEHLAPTDATKNFEWTRLLDVFEEIGKLLEVRDKDLAAAFRRLAEQTKAVKQPDMPNEKGLPGSQKTLAGLADRRTTEGYKALMQARFGTLDPMIRSSEATAKNTGDTNELLGNILGTLEDIGQGGGVAEFGIGA